MNKLRVYIGHDEREQQAFDVAKKTAEQFHCEVVPLEESRLRMAGMLWRPVDHRGGMYDFNSSAAQATSFAITRFFVPLLAHSGWCLFVDSDVLFLRDPHVLLAYADESKAVQVVQHTPQDVGGKKMHGQIQAPYHRKLWSSVMLWNATHPANHRLNLSMLNQWPGRDLHRFGWLADDEIGSLPPDWNYLVGMENPEMGDPSLLHFTLGVPSTPGYENSEFADVWREAAR
jgi:lipopolysaccharide biosynthesis glycosyltransferase